MVAIHCIFLAVLCVGAYGQGAPCEILEADGSCLWTEVRDSPELNLEAAEQVCSSQNSEIAHITSEAMLGEVMANLRSKIPAKWHGIWAWTATTIDTSNGQNNNPNPEGFSSWGLPQPELGAPEYTNVAILVKSTPNEGNQGMVNIPPTWRQHGVVCRSTS